MSNPAFEVHVEVTRSGTTALDWLAAECDLSRARLKQVMSKGAVWLTEGNSTRRLRRAKKVPPSGSSLHLYYDEAVLSKTVDDAVLIADEQRYSVWYKPYGMWSQGSKWGDHCSLCRWAELYFSPQRTAFIVHRLDRAASGLMMLAHDKGAAQALSKLFHDRQVEKTYQVVVHGEFPRGGTKTIREPLDDREACSHFTCLEYDHDTDRTLLRVQIETGRKHQIRRHLAGLGFPVVGDRLYGTGDDDQDLQLTACRLQFDCPLSGETRDYALPGELMPSL